MKDDNIDVDRLQIEMRKKNLIDALESGSIDDPLKQYAFVDQFLLDILSFTDKEQTKTIVEYLEAQDKLKDKIKEINNKIIGLQEDAHKLLEEFTNNGKNIYEEIKNVL